MELSNQIKRYRTKLKLSQEELAEKIYVSRQTISNWENGKNYPDIRSLILLSNVFEISLDQLIKGDIDIMKEEIKETEINLFNYYGGIYAILLIATLILPIPLIKFLGGIGIVIWGVLLIVTFFFAIKVEKLKKKNNIQTYKEIVAFTEGKRLDELESVRESGKRVYQKILAAISGAVIAMFICSIMFWLLK